MNVNKLLSTYVNNIGSIVEVLFIIVLVLFLPILYFSFRKKSEGSSVNAEGLEETLKKVLEATRHQPAAQALGRDHEAGVTVAPKHGEELQGNTAESSDGISAAVAAVVASGGDSEAFKAQIAEREKLIGELKTKLGELESSKKAQVATPGADVSGLETKIKDLEARLREYEIIEDDIANLSLYKEENVRLKNELNKLRGGAPAEAAAPSADQIADKTETVPPSEPLEEALKKAGSQNESEIQAELAKAMSEVPQEAPAATPTEEKPQDDLVSQLANVVENKAPAASAPEPAQPVAAEPAPAAAAATPASTPAEPAPVEGQVPEALKSFDPDKIAEEAGKLEEAPASDAAAAPPVDEAEIGQKLIDEFENFMKENKT